MPAVHDRVVKRTYTKLQAVARHGPEYHGQGHRAGRDERGDPQRPSDEELLNVRLADAERTERCGLGLAQEDEDRVQFILMRNKEENGDAEWEKKLRAGSESSLAGTDSGHSRRNVSIWVARLGR